MKLTLEQVRHVAKLSKLSLSPDEQERARKQLSAILEAARSIAALDLSGVRRSALAQGGPLEGREDDVRGQLPVDVALQNAPQKVATQFAIPKVIE
jgi:aspartyl-tRNA(Asn)/glutamyl-tRNA(Gln) amidotransferase subunit C